MKRVEAKVNGQYLKAKTQLIALNPSLSEEFDQSLKEVQKISEELSIDLNIRPQNLDHKTYYKICELYENQLIK